MKAHYLKRNAQNELPSRVVCVDTEATITPGEGGETHTLRLGASYYLKRRGIDWEESLFRFKTKEEFWGYLDNLLLKGTTLYIIGHNMAYDYAILDLDNWLSSREFTIDQFVINQAFIVRAHKEKCGVKIIDTMNWFKAPLRKLGEVFGVDKGEIADFRTATDEELLPYCVNDTNIVKTVFMEYVRFISEHDLGNFAVTSAGQAFNAYRHRFMPDKSILIHGEPGIYELEQATYRGGRCDIFKYGAYDNIVKLDINSMYPFVMKEYQYPTIPLSKAPITGLTVDDIKQAINDGYYVVGEFDILLKEPFLALKRDKLIFPVGKISRAPMTNPELEYLLSGAGDILGVSRAMLYRQASIFCGYVDYFYKLKVEAHSKVMKELSKLFLNSLYGKFGQKEYGDIVPDDSPEHEMICSDNHIGSYWVMDGAQHYKIMRIGDRFYRVEPSTGNPGKQSSPIISSAVTSYARLYLWKLMKVAGIDNVYYCDTDSIFTNRRGYEALDNRGYIDNQRLGKLKIEGLGSVVLRGPKDYDWIDQETGKLKRTIKGVPSSSLDMGEGNFQYRQWETGLNRYMAGSTAEVVIKDKVKHLTRAYDKGIIALDGTVHPFILNEL